MVPLSPAYHNGDPNWPPFMIMEWYKKKLEGARKSMRMKKRMIAKQDENREEQRELVTP